MQINPLILIGGGLAVMFFGYFFGLFEGRGQGRKRALAEFAQKEKEAIIEQPAPPAPAAASTPDDPGLLRLKDEQGLLRLELDGSAVEAAVMSIQQRRRLIEVVTRMRPWLEPPQPAKAASAPASMTPPVSPQPQPAAPVQPAPLPPAPVPARSDEPASAPSSMIAQIDDILQKKIAGTTLAERGIRIMDAPGGGVVVLVGRQRYPAVSDVPDAEVQAALRAAIATWEQKYTPGL